MAEKINIQETLNRLLKQEDTDNDGKITVEDNGPKKFTLKTKNAEIQVFGTYFLSNLLQILAYEKEKGNEEWEIDETEIFKNPEEKISDQIKDIFWDGLTRKLDREGLSRVLEDSKMSGEERIIYVPFNDHIAKDYYGKLQEKMNFRMEILPENITPEFVLSINSKPGILSLKLNKNGEDVEAEPFVVPGGRFNEMYGWDSYFQNVGLLIDGKFELAKSVIENFEYQILHYGKILNANRSYYLTRTQPPFFSSMIVELLEYFPQHNDWIRQKLSTCITEYFEVWMQQGKRLTEVGLNRYLAEGIGLPWETETGHFDWLLKPFAETFNLELIEFESLYKQRKIDVPELDEYFRNDRSTRESGHDTTHRFGNFCTHILPVELNCMLLKYEQDFAFLIEKYFEDYFEFEGQVLTSEFWNARSENRKNLMEHYFWNEKSGMYSDYDFIQKKHTLYHAATCYFPLWVHLPSLGKAKKMKEKLAKELLFEGGIAASDYKSGGIPNQSIEKQWDYPFGWAPHQMIIWKGMQNYNFQELLQECISRWLKMITDNSMNYNGTITEKYDVVSTSHKVFAEYGNQGTEFRYLTKEGFGWMNASYKLGLDLKKRLL